MRKNNEDILELVSMETCTLINDGFQVYHFESHWFNVWRKKKEDRVKEDDCKIIGHISSKTNIFRILDMRDARRSPN